MKGTANEVKTFNQYLKTLEQQVYDRNVCETVAASFITTSKAIGFH